MSTGFPDLDALRRAARGRPDARRRGARGRAHRASWGGRAARSPPRSRRSPPCRSRSGSAYGAAVNQLKRGSRKRSPRARAELARSAAGASSAGVDLTMPGRAPLDRRGAPGHPGRRRDRRDLPRARLRGGRRARGRRPSGTTSLALNFPADHPAMDMHDTLYLDAPPRRAGRTAAAAHPHLAGADPDDAGARRRRCGSSIPGMVYRNDAIDASHAPAFSQIEGLAVDEGITFVDLKATLTHFARRFFAPTTQVRFRPSFFPFTEPSAEMDVECQLCHGSGCPACKGTGWMEILGCGMVHPTVLENADVDPERYTGLGVRHGAAPDRACCATASPTSGCCYDGDMRFLEQVGRPGRYMNVSLRWLEAFPPPGARRARRRATGWPCSARRWTRSSRCTGSWRRSWWPRSGGRAASGSQGRPGPRLPRWTTAPARRLTVVCGAPNVTAGKRYPFARWARACPAPRDSPSRRGRSAAS